MWARRRSGRALAAALLGGAIFALGMAAGGGGGTLAAYSDYAVFHDSAGAGAPDPLPAVPAACGGLAHARARYGTDGDDRLTVDPDVRVLMGLGGDDTLVGGTGRNCLVGGPGHDVCIGTQREDVFVDCEEVVPSDSPADPGVKPAAGP